jgi:hypothetical protein
VRGHALIASALRSLGLPGFELARSTLSHGALAVALGDRVLMAHDSAATPER